MKLRWPEGGELGVAWLVGVPLALAVAAFTGSKFLAWLFLVVGLAPFAIGAAATAIVALVAGAAGVRKGWRRLTRPSQAEPYKPSPLGSLPDRRPIQQEHR